MLTALPFLVYCSPVPHHVGVPSLLFLTLGSPKPDSAPAAVSQVPNGGEDLQICSPLPLTEGAITAQCAGGYLSHGDEQPGHISIEKDCWVM